MAALNPMQLMMMLKNGNPRQVAYQIIQQKYPNDPQMQNLLRLGQQGDVQSLQKIAQNVLGAQGKDFSAEMQNLMQAVRHFQ